MLICWQIEMTLLRTARLSEASLRSSGARYVWRRDRSLESLSARAILSSTFDIRLSSRASSGLDMMDLTIKLLGGSV